MGFILASTSPRRRALMEMLGVGPFRVIPSGSEELVTPGLTPEQTVCKLATEKVFAVSQLSEKYGIMKDDIIIAADTMVFLDGHLMSKPDSEHEAVNMLSSLSGRRHTVFTGVAVVRGDVSIVGAESTDVYFRDIKMAEILKYVKTGEPMDKAGAYGAQGYGAVFVERVEGDFYNVVGLPLCRLSIMLRDFDVYL